MLWGWSRDRNTLEVTVDPKAEHLLAAMRKARERELSADSKYRHALAQAEDTSYSPDGTAGLRIAAEEYRAAMEHYAAAVKAWSDYVFQR